ncbi:tail fiber assembly protein [uncultured Bilophila sp.]|uniref:tail fiber assembly protein n=1 Tax=uncultured Bilophila sp. TaxID=529385 RepID=UPI00259ACDFF|nr:tail fiber assembly protein [uncultured Bilophila sp.]
MIDFSHIIHRTVDDSYVITKNGKPYHVYPYSAEFAEEWDAVFSNAEAHPECVTEEQPYTPPVPTTEELAVRVRAERNKRLALTDHFVMPDYPISQDKLEEIKVYRQALRDLPEQLGFPWGGPDDPACPWPTLDETTIAL